MAQLSWHVKLAITLSLLLIRSLGKVIIPKKITIVPDRILIIPATKWLDIADFQKVMIWVGVYYL